MLRIFTCAGAACALYWMAWTGTLPAADALPEPAADEAAKAKQQVIEALRAEARGDNAARARGLTSAWLAAPVLAEANWHLGRVNVDGQWLTLADAELAAGIDPLLEEYRELRDGADNSRLLLGLARWCLKNGMQSAARLHYAQVLASKDADDKARQEAIKRLDLHRVGDEWITGEELAARQAEAKAIEAAMAKWRPRLKTLQVAIDGFDFELRDKAIEELQQIDDPTVIPVLESFLLDGKDRFQEEAVKRLAQFPHFEATQALARFALLSTYQGARDAAVSSLRARPKHESIPLLLSALAAPLQSRFKVGVGGRGVIYISQLTAQETPRERLIASRNVVAQPVLWQPKRGIFQRTAPNAFVVSALARSLEMAAYEADLQARTANRQTSASNRRVYDVLEDVADAQVPREPSQWWQWWQNYNGYQWPRPTRFVYQTQPTFYYGGIGQSCFVAGTPVRTLMGNIPIEAIQSGDQVLAQDQDSGELNYKTVLRTTVRPPSPLIRLNVGAEVIRTTEGHPFWVSGHGWKMAKELVAGDKLHSLGGAVTIESVAPEPPQQAHNLVVEDFNTYFVGEQGLLVHDNEFRKPTRAIVPGLVAD